jgi:hypothetical protein
MLLASEGVDLSFTPDAIAEVARVAELVNTQVSKPIAKLQLLEGANADLLLLVCCSYLIPATFLHART